MGGMVGQWLGANAPQQFHKIVLCNTSCYYPDPTNWLNRIKAVKEGGIASVADAVIGGWLTADFREREPQIAANMKAMLMASPVQGYLACCEALSTLDQRALLPGIKSPTLVIAGRHDMATPVAAGKFIRSQIPGAALTILDAAHISNVEQPHAFTEAVVGFLTQRWNPSRHCERSEAIHGATKERLDCFVAEPVIGPVRRPDRWLLAMTSGEPHGRSTTPRRRHGPAPQGARRCLGR